MSLRYSEIGSSNKHVQTHSANLKLIRGVFTDRIEIKSFKQIWLERDGYRRLFHENCLLIRRLVQIRKSCRRTTFLSESSNSKLYRELVSLLLVGKVFWVYWRIDNSITQFSDWQPNNCWAMNKEILDRVVNCGRLQLLKACGEWTFSILRPM